MNGVIVHLADPFYIDDNMSQNGFVCLFPDAPVRHKLPEVSLTAHTYGELARYGGELARA